MGEKGDSSLQSLDDVKDLAPSGGNAKVRGGGRRVKEQKWSSNDRAESLLADINNLLGDEAEEEEERIRAEIRAREEEEKRRKEEEAQRKRREGEQRLAEEKKRVEEIEKRRTMMAEAIERENAIAAGEIDPEAEARAAEEAEAKRKQQEQNRVQKDQALTDAQRLIEEQKQALQRLTEVSMQPVPPPTELEPPKSNLVPIILVAVLLIGGAIAAVLVVQNNKQQNTEKPKPLPGVTLVADAGKVTYELEGTYKFDELTASPAMTSAVQVVPLFDPEDAKKQAVAVEEDQPKKKRRRRSKKRKKKNSSTSRPSGGGNNRLKNLKLRSGPGITR